MKKAALLLLIVFIVACQPRAAAPAAGPTVTARPAQTETATAVPTITSPTPAPSLTPTPDTGIITPANAGHLVQINQLGKGTLIGPPLYAPDGKWLFLNTTTGVYRYDPQGDRADTSGDRTDTTTYQSRLLLPGYSIEQSLAIAPDGKTLAVGNDLIAVEDGQRLRKLETPEGFGNGFYPYDAKFSADGALLAQADVSGTLGVWRVADGKLLYQLQGRKMVFSPDGRLLAAQGHVKDRYHIYLYDLQTGSRQNDWPGERASFLPEHRLAVDGNGAVRIFDQDTGRTLRNLSGQFAAFSLDGQSAALLASGQIRVVNVADGRVLSRLQGDFINVDDAALQFSPDGQFVAGITARTSCCGGYDATLTLWRAADGAVIKKIDHPAYPANRFFAFSPDGQFFAIPDEPERVQIWRTSDGFPMNSLDGFTAGVTGLAFLPDGQQVVAATFGNYMAPLLFYQVDSGRLIRSQTANISGPDYGFAIRSDGKIGALGNSFWRVADGKPVDSLTGKMVKEYSFVANGIAFSPDSRRVAAGYLGGRLQLWDFDQETLLMQQTVCSWTVTSLSFSPDGQRLALACSEPTGNGEGGVQVWQTTSQGQRLMELNAEPGFAFNRVMYSPDGKMLAASGNLVELWDAADGKRLWRIDSVNIFIYRMAFSPDGQILAVGQGDGSVELWDVAGRERLISLPGTPYDMVKGLAFSPDGRLLAMGLDDGSVRIWGIR